jgi:hypothetical protein
LLFPTGTQPQSFDGRSIQIMSSARKKRLAQNSKPQKSLNTNILNRLPWRAIRIFARGVFARYDGTL